MSTPLKIPTPAANSAERFVRRQAIRHSGRASAPPATGSSGAGSSQGGGRVRIGTLRVQFLDAPAQKKEGIRRKGTSQVLARARPRARALAKGGGQPVPPGFEGFLARSPGQPLSAELAAKFEAVLGGDFGSVKIHDDDIADQATGEIEAEAFALGEDIYFARGKYSPRTARGQALLGHELTHVAQQQGGARTIQAHRPIHAMAAQAGERVAARSSGTIHTSPATSALSDLELERLRAVREILAYEKENGTWETVKRYNAITGSIPGRNVWVRTSEGNVADLCWMFDVAWAAGVTGGTASDVLGGVFGGPGQWAGAALTTSAVGLSYWGARIAGGIVEGWDNSSFSSFGRYVAGGMNEDNMGGMVLARKLSVSAALGEKLTIREVLHPTVLEQVERLPRRKALKVAGRDMLELQAEANERAILLAASTGGGWERLMGEGAGASHAGEHGVYRSLL
ncbi:MAG: DUF4157 domain-containing protein, partial [Planctomycetes bacterium]|nr:DUF4157 domain-containing protein [Planctomycetota bacterium]